MDPVEKIAAAVMYEGYVLWPYRRSAGKNRQRWTFGGVFPRAFSEAAGTNDPWVMQTQCLLRGDQPRVSARVRFLQVVERRVGRCTAAGDLEFVDELSVDGECYLAWDEATEREVRVPDLAPAAMEIPVRVPIHVPAGTHDEGLEDAQGRPVGVLVRSWGRMEGEVEARVERLRHGLYRLTLRIVNTTPWEGEGREATLRHALVSTHSILTVEGGEFISLTDPEPEYGAAAAGCCNLHTWPVLAGTPGERRTMLSSPIILPDYPQVAPESPGDLFDGAEIDQLLVLNILSLTDAEKREMRASDPRTREILERTEALTSEDFMRLHGTLRDFRMLRPTAAELTSDSGTDPFLNPFGGEPATGERPAPECVMVNGVPVRKGSRVRLRPGSRRDLMDGILAGKAAIVEAIEEDYEERVHVAVVVEDDPGRELGEARMMGHRFFFGPDEIEPLDRTETTP